MLTHLAYVGGRVTVALAALNVGASAFTVGVLASLFAVVPMLLAVTVGRLVDRIGVRGPMTVGAAGMAAGAALAFFLPQLATLFVASVVVGTAFMLFHMAANHAAGTLGPPAERVRSFSLLALGFSTSGFLGPIVAGFAIDGLGHWNAFLLLAAFPAAAFTALVAARVALPGPRPRTGAPAGRNAFELLAKPGLRKILVVSALANMTWDLFVFLVPIYGTGIGLAASTIGLVLGTFGAAIFVVRVALPFLARRFGEWNLLAAALAVACAVFVALPLVANVPLLMALAFAFGAGLGMSQPIVMALLYAAAPEGRAGEALGLRTTLLNFSQTAIPLLSGALGAAVGMAPVFWTMAVALAAGAAYAGRRRTGVDRRHERS
jgi:predicted MFS family arabinose efflux permease